MTEEQKQAARDRLLAYHAKKKAAKESQAEDIAEMPVEATQEPVERVLDEDTVTIPKSQLDFIMERLKALDSLKKEPQVQQPVVSNGRVQGVTQVYSINPNDYPDPREELMNLPQLVRLAFKENYLLDWNLSSARWQSADGLWFVEPKFELAVWKKLYDDEGNIRNVKALVGKIALFEDPADAMSNWEEAGIEGDPDSKENRDKLRMFRLKQYLLERMFPPRQSSVKKKAKQEVIGGMVVDMEEYSAEV